MKRLAFLIVLVSGLASAGGYEWEDQRPHKDAWGNSYKRYENLDKDSDGDGITNRYDYNDRNPRVQNKYQADFDRGYRKARGW